MNVNKLENIPLIQSQANSKTNGAKEANFKNILDSTMAKETDLDQLFQEASEKCGVPSQLLKAVAKVKSNYNPKAVSSAGASGLMQLMPATARSLGVTDVFDARQNINGGAKYLSQLFKKYDGDLGLTLAAYNAGPGNVDKHGGVPPFQETQNYLVKVDQALKDGGQDISFQGQYSPQISISNDGKILAKLIQLEMLEKLNDNAEEDL